MDFNVVKDLLVFLLPGGAIGSVVTWFATRRERKAGVLSKLQESIDLLTNKYTEALDENVQLKADNAKLLANQRSLEAKIDELNVKIDILTEQLNTKKKNEKSYQGAHSPRNSRGIAADGRVRNTEQSGTTYGSRRRNGDKKPVKSNIRDVNGQPSSQLSESAGGGDVFESGVCGTDSAGGSEGDDSDAESARPSRRGQVRSHKRKSDGGG